MKDKFNAIINPLYSVESCAHKTPLESMAIIRGMNTSVVTWQELSILFSNRRFFFLICITLCVQTGGKKIKKGWNKIGQSKDIKTSKSGKSESSSKKEVEQPAKKRCHTILDMHLDDGPEMITYNIFTMLYLDVVFKCYNTI